MNKIQTKSSTSHDESKAVLGVDWHDIFAAGCVMTICLFAHNALGLLRSAWTAKNPDIVWGTKHVII